MSQFDKCSQCNTILEMFHPWRYQEDWNGGYICKTCVQANNNDVSVPPWPDHMMSSIEPYIKWRENKAIGDFALKIIDVKGCL